MIVRLCKRPNGTPQRYLHVWGLQLAVRKVCSELQLSTDIILFVLSDTPSLQFDRNPKQVFTRGNDSITPLHFHPVSAIEGRENEMTNLLGFLIRRHNYQE